MIIVFGAGISGLGAVKLLESKGKEVALIDDKVSKLKTEDGLRFIEEKEIEYIVKSPGISFKSKLITKAMEKNIPIYSEIDIAYEYMDKNIEIKLRLVLKLMNYLKKLVLELNLVEMLVNLTLK